MPTKQCTIINKLGLHARAASKLVDTANRFHAEVTITKDDTTANAKSIMGIMLLAASKGTELSLAAEGNDAPEALHAIEQLIQNRFGEAE